MIGPSRAQRTGADRARLPASVSLEVVDDGRQTLPARAGWLANSVDELARQRAVPDDQHAVGATGAARGRSAAAHEHDGHGITRTRAQWRQSSAVSVVAVSSRSS